MAYAPLVGQDGHKEDSNFGKQKADYFLRADWTTQITLNSLAKFAPTRTAFLAIRPHGEPRETR